METDPNSGSWATGYNRVTGPGDLEVPTPMEMSLDRKAGVRPWLAVFCVFGVLAG